MVWISILPYRLRLPGFLGQGLQVLRHEERLSQWYNDF